MPVLQQRHLQVPRNTVEVYFSPLYDLTDSQGWGSNVLPALIHLGAGSQKPFLLHLIPSRTILGVDAPAADTERQDREARRGFHGAGFEVAPISPTDTLLAAPGHMAAPSCRGEWET